MFKNKQIDVLIGVRSVAGQATPQQQKMTNFNLVLDAFIGKKKLKDALSNVLSDVK